MFAAPDYKALYFELFRASEQAARLLWEAQQKAEQEALRADPLKGGQGPETVKRLRD